MAGRLHAALPGRASHHRRPDCPVKPSPDFLATKGGLRVAHAHQDQTKPRSGNSQVLSMRQGIQEKGLMLTSLCSCRLRSALKLRVPRNRSQDGSSKFVLNSVAPGSSLKTRSRSDTVKPWQSRGVFPDFCQLWAGTPQLPRLADRSMLACDLTWTRLGFRVWGLGFRALCLGFRVLGLGV